MAARRSTAGSLGWTPIGAVQVAGGATTSPGKIPARDQYTVWSTDSNGNYISNIVEASSPGNSTALENFETIFDQDLNGDGTIGPPPPPPPTIIQTDGTTSLVRPATTTSSTSPAAAPGPELK